MKRRIYGNGRTRLRLGITAQEVYDMTDPLTIIEYEDEVGACWYDVTGALVASHVTADQLNALLIDFNDLEDMINETEA